jgi:hypothetical protein
MKDFDPPAEVRPAENLRDLAKKINAAHVEGARLIRKGLEHYRDAGRLLHQAKEQCGHGKWLPWVEKNLDFDRRTATNYMRIADKWETISHLDGLREAIHFLADRDPPGEQPAAEDPSFDHEGVAKVLTNPRHQKAFRERVTLPWVAEILPVDQQARLAERIVTEAAEDDRELTGAFIKENVTNLAVQHKEGERRQERREQQEAERKDPQVKAERIFDDFERGCRTMASAGVHMISLLRDWPKAKPFAFPRQLRHDAENVIQTLSKLLEQI